MDFMAGQLFRIGLKSSRHSGRASTRWRIKWFW
nr:MAG TPA: hypothetical protein [Caudoviricetes sp.]